MTVSCTSVHGNVVIAENISGGALDTVGGAAYTDRVGQSYGWGKTFQFVGGYGRENWFHIPVPTLGVLDGSDMFLDRFDVLFVTEGDCAVDGVDYWNSWGATSASRFESIQRGPFRGDWSFAHEQDGIEIHNRDGTIQSVSDVLLSNTFTTRDRISDPSGHTRWRRPVGLGISVHVTTGPNDNPPRRITCHGAVAYWTDLPRDDGDPPI